MWITGCVFQYVVRGEWPVIQSSPASRHWQATKKPILPRQKSGKGPLGGQKRIRDSPFKLFGRRSEAGVLMAGQLLIVRVRLRDRSSALKGLAGLAGTSCVSPKGPSHAWASRPMIQHNRPTTARNNPSAQGGRGRTGVPAPESGEHTLPQRPAPNHGAGINTVKRVD